MDKKYPHKQFGFTLIEMAVALGIFMLLITAVMRVYTNGFNSQKHALEMQALQRDGSYIMEVISREVRMAQSVSNTAGSTSTLLAFKGHGTAVNPAGDNVVYCRAVKVGNSVSCSATGDSFAISQDGGGSYNVINSSDVLVTKLQFISSAGDYAKSEPMVTVVMILQSKKDPGATLTLQTAVAMRLYSTHL
jgi:type II secretory pathway pseudopilin PulG